MWSDQKDDKTCYYALQQIHRASSSSTKFMNQTDKHQRADQWFRRSHMSSQVNYTAVNSVLILLDSQITVWEWREKSR